MDALVSKFQPGVSAHYYVVLTLSRVAHANPAGFVPFLKSTLGTAVANMRSVRKDNMRQGITSRIYMILSPICNFNEMKRLLLLQHSLSNVRYVYADALSRFSEALLEYLTNFENVPDPSVTKDHFVKELDLAHDIMFSSWLSRGDAKGLFTYMTSAKCLRLSTPSLLVTVTVSVSVIISAIRPPPPPSVQTSYVNVPLKAKQSVLEALGQMAGLLSQERVSKAAGPILSVLVNTYKRVPEPYYVTQCISQLIDAVIAREQSPILDSMIEPLLTALFTQVHTANLSNLLRSDYLSKI